MGEVNDGSGLEESVKVKDVDYGEGMSGEMMSHGDES